jgi:hypothetical protein
MCWLLTAHLVKPPGITSATQKSVSLPGKPRTQATQIQNQGGGSKIGKSQPNTPKKGGGGVVAQSKTADNSPSGSSVTGAQRDLAGLHLDDSGEIDEDEKEREKERYKERVGLSMKQEELVAKVKKDEEESGKSNISLIVVGELDVWLSVLTELMKDRTCWCWKEYADGEIVIWDWRVVGEGEDGKWTWE